jgi:hypothetical protein
MFSYTRDFLCRKTNLMNPHQKTYQFSDMLFWLGEGGIQISVKKLFQICEIWVCASVFLHLLWRLPGLSSLKAADSLVHTQILIA